MGRSLTVLTAALLVMGVSACGGDSDAEDAAEPITIMPIGDSITSCQAGWSTYRCYLDGMLNDAGISFDFVGSKSQPTNGPYGCPTSFDEDHESYWGQYVVGVAHSATASVEVLQPDVALIHVGTNDITGLRGVASTASKLESFITDLQAVKPDLTILVAQLIPCDAMGFDPLYEPQCSEDLPAFNDHLASFTSLSTDRSSVTVVDMETGFGLDLLRDGLHPTDAGFEFMAARWMTALEEAGVIGRSSASTSPEPPNTEAQPRRWQMRSNPFRSTSLSMAKAAPTRGLRSSSPDQLNCSSSTKVRSMRRSTW